MISVNLISFFVVLKTEQVTALLMNVAWIDKMPFNFCAIKKGSMYISKSANFKKYL